MIWGVLGFTALLASAVYRLSSHTAAAVANGLTWWEWCIAMAWVIFNAHAEGVRGFHHNMSPRVVARAQHLAEGSAPWHWQLFAPAFVIGLFGATKKRKVIAWAVTMTIVAVVVVVRSVPQPWRGIIDAGVVVGLGIGILSLFWFFGRAMRGHRIAMNPDLPEVVG